MCWISFARMSIQRQEGKKGKKGTDLLCIDIAACVLQSSVVCMCNYKPDPLPIDRESTALVEHCTWILISFRLLDILFVTWRLPWV
jgi:hypothetical protein